MVFERAEFGLLSPLKPIRFGVAARPTHRPISNGQGPRRVRVLVPLQLQGADQRRRAAELVEGQQPERVAHQHAQPRRGIARVFQAAIDQREGGQAEIGFRLAAAGREEEQIDHLPVVMVWVHDAGEVHQDERKLERTPGRRIDRGLLLALHGTEATPGGLGHHAVGHAEGEQRVLVVQNLDAVLDALRRGAGPLKEGFSHLAALGCQRGQNLLLVRDPIPVLLHERPECLLSGRPIGQLGEGVHAKLNVQDLGRSDALDLGCGNPARAGGVAGALLVDSACVAMPWPTEYS